MKGFTDTCLCQRKPKYAGQQNCQKKKLFLVRPQLFSSSYQVSWFTSLCRGILDNDRPTLDLDQVHEDQPLLRGFLLHLKQSVLLWSHWCLTQWPTHLVQLDKDQAAPLDAVAGHLDLVVPLGQVCCVVRCPLAKLQDKALCVFLDTCWIYSWPDLVCKNSITKNS